MFVLLVPRNASAPPFPEPCLWEQGLDPTPNSSCQVGFSCPEGTPWFPGLEQVSKWSSTEQRFGCKCPMEGIWGDVCPYVLQLLPVFQSQVCGGFWWFFGLVFPACNATSLGYGPFPLEHSTSTSEAVITILIFTIRACGPLLYQKEFPVNEILITESRISGGSGNFSITCTTTGCSCPACTDKTKLSRKQMHLFVTHTSFLQHY